MQLTSLVMVAMKQPLMEGAGLNLRYLPTRGLSFSISSSVKGSTGGARRKGVFFWLMVLIYSMARVTTLSFSASLRERVQYTTACTRGTGGKIYGDVMTWKCFSHYWSFRSPSPKASNADLRWWFAVSPQRLLEQTVDLPAILDVMTLCPFAWYF